jgi:flavin reductase (DIM6/NTAB) family NADH-FMN oxidoreductase RutF
MVITPGEISTKQLHAYLLGSVAPRPICFASTIDKDGNANLAPFSFFNVFGAKPPVCIFSPARRVRDNTVKHTLENIRETREVVINVVSYDMVQQMNLASCEYPKGVNEFEKSGFTPVKSELIKPFRVKEAPVSLECKLLQVIETGTEGGAANLVICEIVKMHIDERILDDKQQIDPHKIDLVARMGQDYYCRASGDAVFEVQKPNLSLGIGMDALPLAIRNSSILTGNDLGILANSTEIPVVMPPMEDERLKMILQDYSNDETLLQGALHEYAKDLLHRHEVALAWQVLLTEAQTF